MSKLISVLVLSSSIVMSGCTTEPKKSDVGMISGGVIGGLVGSLFGGGSGKVAAAAGGALLGAFLGSKIGESMDKTDQLEAQQAMNSSQPTTWTNTKGTTYKVTPKPTYTQNSKTCRQYTTTATIDGKAETINGTACKNANGTWQIQ
jgi:surface antigen